jgi:hypothetical protein
MRLFFLPDGASRKQRFQRHQHPVSFGMSAAGALIQALPASKTTGFL